MRSNRLVGRDSGHLLRIADVCFGPSVVTRECQLYGRGIYTFAIHVLSACIPARSWN